MLEERYVCGYEGPNPYLYKFNGSLQWMRCTNPSPLTADNFLLRGSKLMNVRYVIGVIVYTGHDTKIMLNSVKAKPKKSELEITMNYMIIIIFAIQMFTCLFAALYNVHWEITNF